MLQIFIWWLIAELLGLAALPLTTRVLHRLPDQGYTFSKTVGILIAAYLLWIGASTILLQNNLVGIISAIALMLLLSTWLTLRAGLHALISNLKSYWRQHRWQILTAEILFLAAFLIWLGLRAYAPGKIMSAYGEKYMEIAFLNGVLRSPHFPPIDPWMAGKTISYYYFGYVMMALFTRLSGAAPTVGFDLYDALVFALTALTAYGLVYNLVGAARGSRRAATITGLVGSLFVVGMGNLEGMLHSLYSARLLPASFVKWIDIPGLTTAGQTGSLYPGQDFTTWWWWSASRVLNDLDLFHQPTHVLPITEFPFFTFLLGDNHPHKMALPFCLLAAGLAFNLFLWQTCPSEDERPVKKGRQWIENGSLFFFYALAVGALLFLNTWDFPVYLILTLAAFGTAESLRERKVSVKVLKKVLGLGAGLSAASFLLYLPFFLTFSSQAGGVLPYVFPPTRLAQYLIMFGLFAFVLTFFLLQTARAGMRRFPIRRLAAAWAGIALLILIPYLILIVIAGVLLNRGMLLPGGFQNPLILQWTGGLPPSDILGAIIDARMQDPAEFIFLSGLLALAVTTLWNAVSPPHAPPTETTSNNRIAALSIPAMFALLMALVGIGLTFSVDFIYLVDMFGLRMNTVFKFYFQGWALMACASAFACWWLLRDVQLKRWLRGLFLTGVITLSAGGLVYTGMAAYSRVHGFSYPPDLNGGATLAGEYAGHWDAHPDDWAAINWMRSHIAGVPTILEAPASDWATAGRISAFTGFPTLLGWSGHEYQWRGNYDEIRRRMADIESIYTAPDEPQFLGLLHLWKVQYVIVGDAERRYLQETCARRSPHCDVSVMLKKFSSALELVYSQGSISVYQVP